MRNEAADLIQVVLDEASVERLRDAATLRGVELEQLMVQILHTTSYHVEEVLRSG